MCFQNTEDNRIKTILRFFCLYVKNISYTYPSSFIKEVLKQMRNFFTDREFGSPPASSERISVSVWNGIISLIEKYQLCFAKDFPDNPIEIKELKEDTFFNTIEGFIPYLPVQTEAKSFKRYNIYYENDFNNQNVYYSIFDFIEFCFNYIKDYEEQRTTYGNFKQLLFKEGCGKRLDFCEEINQLFIRNGLSFKLTRQGTIERVLPLGLPQLKDSIKLFSNETVNSQIEEAWEYILKPKLSDKQTGLEKLWDAYAGIKTLDDQDTKNSIEARIAKICNGTENPFFHYVNTEAQRQSILGNTPFKIRHFETTKIEIENSDFMDLLFYQLLALICFLSRTP